MDWTRSETIALARQSCAQCHGLGLTPGRNEVMNPCHCVLRAIFRACYARFRHCVSKERHISRVALEILPGQGGKICWGRKDEEYIADFCLVSRRALTNYEYQVFSAHFLLGADWRLCTRRFRMDRGNFFHAVYRIEQRLGREFRELEPYGLFPLSSYFQGSSSLWEETDPIPEWAQGCRRRPGGRPVEPPLFQTA